jgi:hypothetical protein
LLDRESSTPIPLWKAMKLKPGQIFSAHWKSLGANIRMHLTGYSGLRPLPPAGDAGR